MGDLATAGVEALSSFGSSFGGAAEAAAPAFETGIGTIGQAGAGFGEAAGGIGAGLGEAAGGIGGGLSDIVGSGAGLFGGATGLEGTLAPVGGDIASVLGTGGATALGTADAFLNAPGASGFNAGAVTPQAFGGASSFSPASTALSPSVANANAGASVFDTGASPIQGVSGTGAPSAVTPAGNSASSLAPPPGVSSPLGVDPTAAATGASNAAPAAAKSTSISDLLGKVGGGAMDSLTKNPLGTALGAAGLGYNIYSGQKQSANQKALSGAANTAANTSQQALNAGLPIAQANNTTGTNLVNSGEALQKYLSDGTLPPQYTQQIDQAINDAKTRAISNAAAQGQPTDPKLNTALAQTLAGIDNQRSAMTTQVAQTLFNAGSSDINAGAGLTTGAASSLIGAGQSAAGLSSSLYQTLVQNDTQQAANTGKAIATLAAALNGKSQANTGGITISQG